MNKPILESKLNWLGILVTLLGIFNLPQAQTFLSEFIPQATLAKITAGAGLAIIVVRSFFTEVNYEVNYEANREE